MNAKTLLGVLAAALLAAGCSHSQPTPDEQQQQQPPPPAQQQPPPPPPAQQQPPPPPPPQHSSVPQHGGPTAGAGAASGYMPKGAHLAQNQAEQTAIDFARTHGMPAAYPKFSEFRNGAWAVTLHGPGPQPGTENKMDVVVGNDGKVLSHVLIPYGAPGWNQAK